MKKVVCMVMILLLELVCMTTVYAYEDDKLSIEIPDDFNLISFNPKVYGRLPDGYPRVVLAVDNYTGSKFNIQDLTESDLSELARTQEKMAKIEAGLDCKVTTCFKSKIGEYDCVYMLIEYSGAGIYMDSYYIWSDKYIYNIGFASEKTSYAEFDECNNMKNSLVIKDSISKAKTSAKKGFDVNQMLLTGLLGAILAVIFGLVKKKQL